MVGVVIDIDVRKWTEKAFDSGLDSGSTRVEGPIAVIGSAVQGIPVWVHS